MPGFDKNLDKQLFLESAELDSGRINVGVFSYNEGAAKLQITRENKTAKGEYRFAKLGRMTKDETQKVLPLVQKALEFM